MNQYLLSLYWTLWNLTLIDYPVKEGLNDKVLETGIDGYTEKYSLNDIIPSNSNGSGPLTMTLFNEILNTWDERQTINQVPVKYDVQKAITDEINLVRKDLNTFDSQAVTQYFKNPASNKRIAVFGHSHVACIKPSFNQKSQKTVYVNDGAWQHSANPLSIPMTFAVITPQKTSASAPEYVTLYQYSQSGAITKLKDQDAITNLTPVAEVKDGASYK